MALVDNRYSSVKNSHLNFYFENYNNMSAILDEINFSGAIVTCGYDPAFKDYGTTFIQYGEKHMQVIPNYAIPKVNPKSLNKLQACNNQLNLTNKSYYSYTAKNGKQYTWSVKDGRIGWANSESLLADFNEDTLEMRRVSNIITALAQGKSTYGYTSKQVQSALASVGINGGVFSINAGAGEHHYMMKSDGSRINLDNKVEAFNRKDWTEEGYQAGDIFNVFGKEYVIGENGHINMSVDDEFTTSEVIYPIRSKVKNMG